MMKMNSFFFGLLVLCSFFFFLGSSHDFKSPFQSIRFENIALNLDNGVDLKVSPEMLENSGDWVKLTISGVSNPKHEDWIGVYSPSNVDFQKTSPIKYQYAKISKDYLKTGNGEYRFRLVNMHADVVFALFRGGLSDPVLVSTSNTVTFKNLKQPLQPHLALTDDNTKMRLNWASGPNGGEQQVIWGPKSNPSAFHVKANMTTYKASNLCGEPATTYGWRDPGYLYTAIMDNLVPNEHYVYRYGSDAAGWGQSEFVAPPVTKSDSKVSLIAYGDMGKSEIDGSLEHWEETPSLNTTKHVISYLDEIDLVLHIGDISYAVGYSSQWDEFFDQIEPVASKVPYMTCIGNHERDFPDSGSYYAGHDSGGECGVPYETRLMMPTPAKDQPWYSFNYGNIHFVFMSTEHDFRKSSVQYQWIEDDLRKVDRSKTPWVIFSGHRPMYISSTNDQYPAGDQVVAKLLRESIEELFIKYRVNLALWGHHHSYQRTCPVFQENCENPKKAPVHAVIGMAGMGLSQNIEKKPPKYMEFIDDMEYGYTKIDVNATTLHLQFFGNVNGLRDEFYLYL